MPELCPSCSKPLIAAKTDPTSDETASSDSAQVCSSCGMAIPPELVIGARPIAAPIEKTQLRQPDCADQQGHVAHFQLHGILGRGGFGSVWLAEDLSLGRNVALKLPKSSQKDAKLLHEAKTAAKLKHPNIVSIYEVGLADGQVYIASEFIDGINLRDKLTAGRLPRDQAVELLITVTGAVAHAHEHGVVHRDLKPENIMLDESGSPFVTDFGIAKQLSEDETISTDGQVIGTVSYMSPEQARGNTRETDQRSDVYALGTILFEMLTEYRPFRGNPRGIIHQKLYEDPPSPRKLVPNLERDLETICLKCLEREPHKRYQSTRELADELTRFKTGVPILARPITKTEKLLRWCKRNQAVAGLLGGVFLSLSIGLLGISYFWMQSARNAALRQQALYRTHMILASDLLERGDVPSLERTLAKYATGDASQLREFEWYLLSSSLSPFLQTTNHGDTVVDVAISRDGAMFASAGPDRRIRVWRSEDGTQMRTLQVSAGRINSIEFSTNSDRLLSTHADGMARVWNPKQHDREVHSLQHGKGLSSGRYVDNGKTIITVGGAVGLRIWDAKDGQLLKERKDFRRLTDLCLADGHDWVALASQSGTITIWDFKADKVVHQFEVGAGVRSVAFTDDDETVVSTGISNSIAITSLSEGASRLRSYDSNLIGDLESLGRWGQIAIVSSNGSMRLLNDDRQEVARLATHALSQGVIDSSADGRMMVVGSGDGTVKILSIEQLQSHPVLWHDSHIRDIAFLDKERVATCLGDGSVLLHDFATGERSKVATPTGHELLSLAFFPEANRLFASGMQPSILQFDSDTGEQLPELSQQLGGLGAVSASPDGQLLAAGSRSGTVMVFRVTEGKLGASPILELNRAESQVLDVTYSRDSASLVVAYSDNSCVVYDIKSGQDVHEWKLTSTPQTIIASEAEGVYFVGTRTGQLLILRQDDATVESIDAHQGRINALALIPGGKRLLTAGRDQAIHIWDIESKERVAILRRHGRQIFALAVSPDGKCIASGGLAGDLRVWQIK